MLLQFERSVITLSPKMGQKIKDNPKYYLLWFILFNESLDKLTYSSEKIKISCSEVVRRGIEDEYQKALKK